MAQYHGRRHNMIAYRLTDGKIIHDTCRAACQARVCETGRKFPAIEAGLLDGYEFRFFQICEQCQEPITEGAK